ncbi:MAG: histidine triad nucleotide-binding protein [Candidatus Planktophila sp.]|nr:histidine triad nucleotide-binding protein [Candidatus Planktophila sp.]
MQVLRQFQLSVQSYRYGKHVSLDPTCLFCKIIEGDIPADIVFRNENVVAFNDIAPQAPTHVLIIPTLHVENGGELAKSSPTITAELFKVAEQISNERGLSGYRTVFNTGADAGQSVFHAHMHLLGGRALAWPPG